MNILIASSFFIFGTLIGSFLNVLILRLPANRSLVGRSMCPECKTIIRWWQLIPILSYLFLRGRCGVCNKGISSRYLWIELITGLLFSLVAYNFFAISLLGLTELAFFLFIVSIFIVIFVIDLEHYLILDKVVKPTMMVVLVFNLILDYLSTSSWLAFSSYFIGGIVSAIFAGGLFWAIWYFSKGRWMGFGDVKLVVLLGLVLGWPKIIIGLFLAFLLGSIMAVPLVILGRKKMSSAIPFGTFLTIGALIASIYGDSLLNWYLKIIGLA